MRIKEIRKTRGITQEELAERLGVKRTTVSMWELDESAPAARMLPALAEALGCTIDELFREPERVLLDPCGAEKLGTVHPEMGMTLGQIAKETAAGVAGS